MKALVGGHSLALYRLGLLHEDSGALTGRLSLALDYGGTVRHCVQKFTTNLPRYACPCP